MDSRRYEQEFIDLQKAEMPDMTPETEMVYRYAFSVGIKRGFAVGLSTGHADRINQIHKALGLTSEVTLP